MSIYPEPWMDRIVAVDECHAELVRSLVKCHKPRRVLELGFGTGAVTRAIADGLAFNSQAASHEVVDNWSDFVGRQPYVAESATFSGVTFTTESELSFVNRVVQSGGAPYDFIFSDADHHNTHRWWQGVYLRLLSPGGILCYHDVTNPDFPNLRTIYDGCVRLGLEYALFDRSSRPDERCERGLLVIFKPREQNHAETAKPRAAGRDQSDGGNDPVGTAAAIEAAFG